MSFNYLQFMFIIIMMVYKKYKIIILIEPVKIFKTYDKNIDKVEIYGIIPIFVTLVQY